MHRCFGKILLGIDAPVMGELMALSPSHRPAASPISKVKSELVFQPWTEIEPESAVPWILEVLGQEASDDTGPPKPVRVYL